MKRILLAMALVLATACGQVTTSEDAASENVAYEAAAEDPAAAQEAAIVCPGDDRCDNVEVMPATQ